MPVAFNANVVEVQMRYTSLDEQVENTLWLETVSETPPDLPSLVAVGTTLLDWYIDNFPPLVAPTCALREIYLRQALVSGGIEHTKVPLLPVVGTATGDSLPGNVSLVVSFRTGLAGRSYRGRNYSVGMTNNQKDGNQAETSYATGLRNAYAALPAALAVDGDFRHVIYSQFFQGAVRFTGGVTTPVTNYVITNLDLDSQRRRLAGRGD